MCKNSKKIISVMLAFVMLVVAMPMGISATAIYCENGDIIEFGSYPQSKVTDADLIAELESQNLSWNSYNYYCGDNNMGSMTAGDWMQYADVEYNGEKYRCVNFTQYRPVRTCNDGSADNSNQDDSGYNINTKYWFKFDPIKWKVLDAESGLIMSWSVLDSQPFNNNYYADGSMNNNPDDYHCANVYATSSLRTWLNEFFYLTAFNDEECSEIKNATYDGEETSDKVFILSAADAKNKALGFTSNAMRQVTGTEYAKCQGASRGYSRWILRDVGINANYSYQVVRGGSINSRGMVSHSDGGVRPVMQINIQQPPHVHTYTQSVVEPTCLEPGAVYNVCECGDKQLVETKPAKGHSYVETTIDPTCTESGKISNVCSECGDTNVQTLPPIGHIGLDDDGICDACGAVIDATKSCTHICHKGGISGFFYKIARLFWKLFKTNQYCSCGAAHY